MRQYKTSSVLTQTAGTDLAFSESLWHELPPELIKDVARRLIHQMPRSSGVAAVRQACRSWREAFSEAVRAIHLKDSSEFLGLAKPHFLQAFTQLSNLFNLPTRDLISLQPGLPIKLLSLTGTGTDSDYEVLADFPSLNQLLLLGPVTLTSKRFCTLGRLPRLTSLTLQNALFPRTPFGAHACTAAVFAQLQNLQLMNSWPLTRNGVESGNAGRQFLSALKSLRFLTIEAASVSQVLLETLDKLAALEEVHLWGLITTSQLEAWVVWAKPKLVHVYDEGQLVWPYPAS